MSYSNISAVLSAADKAAIQTAVQTIRTKLPFMVTLSVVEHKKLRKMKAARTAYVQAVNTASVNNPTALPGSLNLAEFTKDAALIKELDDVISWVASLNESLNDTHMALGSELMKQADECYGYLKVAAKKSSNQSLKAAVKGIADQLKQKPKAKTPPPVVK